jgi:eukaryotic-like serine/threonine-protein kinase
MSRFILPVLLVAVSAPAFSQAPPLKLVRMDRNGTSSTVGTLPPHAFALRISPDGGRITYDTGDNIIWIADLANVAAPRRLATGRFPMWSADGNRVLFIVANAGGVQQLFWQAADGSGSPELLVAAARAPESWFPGGQAFSYITLKEGGDYDLWQYSLRDRTAQALVALPTSAELSSRVSPDGKWIAYESNDSGAYEIYVEPLPRTGARTKVSTGGGSRPLWTPDGREIYYDRENRLYVAAIDTAQGPSIGTPVALPVSGFIQNFGRRTYDVTADGKQFLMLFR